MEDFDSSFLTTNKKIIDPKDMINILPQKQNIITYSNLLNILDGLTSSYGYILFLTTNYIERIQESLIRPGRIDLVEYVGYIDNIDIVEYLNYFYNNQLKDIQANVQDKFKQFAQSLVDIYKNVTMSELQNYCIKFRKNYNDIFENIKRFKEDNNIKNLSVSSIIEE